MKLVSRVLWSRRFLFFFFFCFEVALVTTLTFCTDSQIAKCLEGEECVRSCY